MRFLKDLGHAVLVAEAKKMGFADGQAGRPVATIFAEPFPQYTEVAIVYHKHYKLGQESAVARTLNRLEKKRY